MPAKIRLARHGKKHNAFYHIVVADGRAPRDGKYIEKIGTYNPNANPAVINLDTDKAIAWLSKGAQPTDTARAILSYKGVLYRRHLLGGVTAGKLTIEQADAKFEAWKQEKEGKITTKKSDLLTKHRDIAKANLALELKAKEAKAEVVRAKFAAPAVVEADSTPAPEGEASAEAPQEPQA